MIIPLILTVALAVPCGAQQKESDRKHDRLTGQVKTVKTEEARLSTKAGKLVEGKRQLVSSITYNEAGALVKATRVSRDSPDEYFYSYDARGERVEFIRFPNETKHARTRFKYDTNGNRIEEEYSEEGDMLLKTVHVCDAQGRRTQISTYGKQGLIIRSTYTYDARGQVSVAIDYDSKGAVLSTKSYSYELDAAGNWIKRITSEQVSKNGQTSFEPVEVTYRTIAYY